MKSTGKRDKENGFTLIELTVVLMLITLILGLSSLFIAGRLGYARFDSFVRELTLLLTQARALAQQSGKPVAVVIDMDARRCGFPDRVNREVPVGIGLKAIDSFSNEITRGKYRIVFQIDGIPEEAAIILWSGRKTVEVRTNPVTGFELKKT